MQKKEARADERRRWEHRWRSATIRELKQFAGRGLRHAAEAFVTTG